MNHPFAIETHDLTKRYESLIAVDRIRFRVVPQTITGFVGRNGAGKSSTIKMLLGMIRPSSGNAEVLGHRCDDQAASLEIRRKVAFVGEDKGLYGYMTAGQLIRFTRSFYDDWNQEREQSLLRQYDLPLNRKVKALSKGMRTKLALLLALARRPDLLILDEPTEGLDPVSIEELMQALSGLTSDGITVFFSSHQLGDVERIADDVIMIDHGKVVIHVSMDEVRGSYRWVNAGFDRLPPQGEFQLPCVERVKGDGRQVSALVRRDAEDVARRARELGAVSVNISPVTLRELFLDKVNRDI